jgi:hypothetical protein
MDRVELRVRVHLERLVVIDRRFVSHDGVRGS